MESIERAVLASFIMNDTYSEEEADNILRLELYEEWFEHLGHKIVVKIINSMKMSGKPIYAELVRKQAYSSGYDIDSLLVDIMTCNIFSFNTFKAYYNDMNTTSRKSMAGLI